jgi:hypothetical protein
MLKQMLLIVRQCVYVVKMQGRISDERNLPFAIEEHDKQSPEVRSGETRVSHTMGHPAQLDTSVINHQSSVISRTETVRELLRDDDDHYCLFTSATTTTTTTTATLSRHSRLMDGGKVVSPTLN